MAHRGGMVSQQPERKLIECGYGDLVGQIRQLVLNVLPSCCGDKLQLHHRLLRPCVDEKARMLRTLGKVLLHLQAGERFFARGAQPQRGGLVPPEPGCHLGKERIDRGKRGQVQRGLEVRAAAVVRFEHERHSNCNHSADRGPITEQCAHFIAEEIPHDGVIVQPQAQGAGERDYQHAPGAEAVAQDCLPAADEEHPHGEHQVGAQHGAGDRQQDGGQFREEGQHYHDERHAEPDLAGGDAGEVDQREAE